MDVDERTGDETLRQLAELPTMAHPTASSDGTEIALYYDGGGRNEVYVLDVGTGTLEQWTDGDAARSVRWSIEWGADDERVYFPVDHDGDEQNDIHAVDRDGTVEPVVDLDGLNVLHDVSDDGEALLVASTAGGQLNLYRHDLGEGETTRLTEYDRAVGFAQFSPEGDRISFGTNESDEYDNFDAYVMDADGSNPRNLNVGETGAESAPGGWHPDGDRLLVSDNSGGMGRCGVYDLRTGEVTWFGDQEFEEHPLFFTPDGERFVATRVRGVSIVPVVYDVRTGEGREFDIPDGVVEFGHQNGMGRCRTSILDENTVVVTHTTATKRPELLAYDLSTDEYEVLLPAEHGPFDDEQFGEAEHFTFRSDGVPRADAHAVDLDPYPELDVDALLYDSGARPSPLIVNPHGGPRSKNVEEFDLYTQFLLLRGYSVLQVNYRGSTGRGREFVEELYGDWGGAEQGDIATGVEYVVDEYDWIDRNRVAVFGASYGGYSAYWQLVQYPELYDAGVAWIGLTDLEDMYENTMAHFQSETIVKYLGDLDENPELYEQRSPVTHAANLDAPLLVLHGVNDPRVPVSQARRFRDELEENGFEEGRDGDFEYVELGGEGHASSDVDHKTRTFRQLDRFLDRRLRRRG